MLLTVPDAEQAALNPRIVENPLENLSGTALRLYQALRKTAQHASAARGYVGRVSHVTVHIPVEIVGLALGRHRVTVWRASQKLQALGLVDARPHKTTALDGRTVNDGELWAVRLDPEQGSAAKLTYEEMKHEGWRDLDRDRRRGRTAYRAVKARAEKMQQSEELSTKGFDLDLLLEWALPPQYLETPLANDCCISGRADLEAVLDVPYVEKEDRAVAVDGAARALAMSLGDVGGLMFYRWLLWQLLRHAEQHGGDYWHFVYEQARRARTDAAEGFARKPGALFTARLKQAPWWEAVRRQAAVRVGPRLMKA